MATVIWCGTAVGLGRANHQTLRKNNQDRAICLFVFPRRSSFYVSETFVEDIRVPHFGFVLKLEFCA